MSLIHKYNVPGPRYTSYPTAVQFYETEPPLIQSYLRERNSCPRDISLYVHLPFCASLCWYCGCTTVITRDASRADSYLDHLEMELKFLSDIFHSAHRVRQIHFGGGTPTFLSPDRLRRLGSMLKDNFNITKDCEFGVEIDPRSFTEDHVKALIEIGMNRASIGFQDVNPEVQQAIHRIQPYEMVENAMKMLRDAGIKSVNLDVIYGLPKQTRERFANTLEAAARLNPDRMAVYSYAHVPWIKPSQKLLKDEDLPNPDQKLMLLQDAIAFMEKSGFDHIGMDHFARADDELAVALRDGTLQRNFQGYSTMAGLDIYGTGMSSISSVGGYYFQNEKSLETWQDLVKTSGQAWVRGYKLSREDELRRWVIMQLMCSRNLNFREVWDKWYVNPLQHFTKELSALKPLEKDRLIELSAEGIRITADGRHYLRNIAMVFDEYSFQQKEKPVFSNTV